MCPCTLKRWDKSSRLCPDSHTPGGHRRYSVTSLKDFYGDSVESEHKKVIAYSRVSSHDQKEDLKKQGFNPAVIEDQLYFYQKGRYVEIDDSLYQRIQSGEERF